MIPKFDINNFEKLKNSEINFECVICGSEFNSTKKYLRRALGLTKATNPPTLKYCSSMCRNKGRMTGIYLKCDECGGDVYKAKYEIEKGNNNVFCSHSCKAIFWNKNKNFGSNRSKLEKWIEDELIREYDFEIIFNDRNLLNGLELDIYIPKLKIAFELNGIFHYQPIFGNNKLKVVENNDLVKFNKCIEEKIDLYVIDTSSSKKFNKEKDRKYLDFIISKIEEKR